jgi:RHS repeat-associated protein
LHGDHLGSASMQTDTAGGIVAEQRYAAYGKERWNWGTLGTDRRYTGQRTTSYGTISFPGREYSPVVGRWLSPDPIVPDPYVSQSLNRYAYVRGNPISRYDPDGHDDEESNNGLCKVLPMFCQPQSPPIANEEGTRQQLTITTPVGVGIVAAQEGNNGGKGKAGGLSGLVNLIRSLLGGAGGAAANKLAQEAGKDGDPTNELSEAYRIAQAGGRHAGFLQNHAKNTVSQIEKSIRNKLETIREHEGFVADPLRKISRDAWASMNPRAQAGVVEFWKKEIANYRQQVDILRDIVREKSGGSNGSA